MQAAKTLAALEIGWLEMASSELVKLAAWNIA